MYNLELNQFTMNFLGAFLGGFFSQSGLLNIFVLSTILLLSFISGLYLQKNINFIENFLDISFYKKKCNEIYQIIFKQNKEKIEIDGGGDGGTNPNLENKDFKKEE